MYVRCWRKPTPTYQPANLPTYLPTYRHMKTTRKVTMLVPLRSNSERLSDNYLPADLPAYLPTYLQTHQKHTYLPMNQPTYLPTYLPTNLPTCLPTNLPTCRHIRNTGKVTMPVPLRSNSERLSDNCFSNSSFETCRETAWVSSVFFTT